MADRLNYYFRQKVTEAELDAGFDGLETADQNMMVDQELVGAFSGLVVTQRAAGANLTVDISAGTAYDPAGQRIRIPTTQNLNVAVDTLGVTTTVSGSGKSKVVSIFVKAKRVLSDPRTDGNSATVYFQSDESFDFYVKQGAEATTGSEVPPALEPDMILIADIRRTNGVGTITNANIQPYASNRRQDTFVNAGDTYNLRAGTIKDAVEAILAITNDVADTIATISSDVTASKAVTDSITAERTAPATKTASFTIADGEQNLYVNITGGGIVTMPDPTTNANKEYYVRLVDDDSKLVRFMPHGSELMNGKAGGFPGNYPGGTFVFKSDGTDWICRAHPGPNGAVGSGVDIKAVVFSTGGSGPSGTVFEVYGAGFRWVQAARQNGFDITGVGGSWVLHDDGWITVTVGGGGGAVSLDTLIQPNPEAADYDGVSYRSSGDWPCGTGISGT